MSLPEIRSSILFVMKNILLLTALSLIFCSCAYYPVGPDGAIIAPVGYGNPNCYGTSGSYGGGYYPVYGGYGGGYGGYGGGYGVYGSYGYGGGGYGYANNSGNTTVNVNRTSTYNGGSTTINRTVYNGGSHSYTGGGYGGGTRSYGNGSGGMRSYGGGGGMRSYGGGGGMRGGGGRR